ncbi:hypothetical protein SGRA_0093 [Saprospira grandis str. Lewin]|uniref:Uncharacterized protein n=1 Tax=Saprospira grandis (strain Lewin) TaxID=984262 RepID=H6L4F9_SAPGL|nr:hypothetical protein SGRA_0093 [Saprospira grandis str. Lewin]
MDHFFSSQWAEGSYLSISWKNNRAMQLFWTIFFLANRLRDPI